MQVFENTIIKKFWPADDKGPDKEMIRQVYIQCEAELDNNRQVSELFDGMVKGLIKITFEEPETGNLLILPGVTVKPFNIKQKNIKLNKGDEEDIVRTEFAALTLVSRMEDGQVLQELLQLFNVNVKMTIDDFSIQY